MLRNATTTTTARTTRHAFLAMGLVAMGGSLPLFTSFGRELDATPVATVDTTTCELGVEDQDLRSCDVPMAVRATPVTTRAVAAATTAALPPDLADAAKAANSGKKGTPIGGGAASFYGKGDGFAGKKTANGEIFDPTELTAAHKTLPLGTRLRVTNAANGKVVEVRVNDRGPYAKGRVLDLSYAAAQQLGFVQQGHAQVRLERL